MIPAKFETVDDFITFYEAIPEEDWCCDTYHDAFGRCCAIGHLDSKVKDAHVVERLCVLLAKYPISVVNDGETPAYDQPNPKARVLAYLNDIKNGVYAAR